MEMNLNSLQPIAESWSQSLTDLFKSDPGRAKRYIVEACGIRFDYSKHWINDNLKNHLISILIQCEFHKKRASFFSGELINHTEHLAALHPALRAGESDQYTCHGKSITQTILQARRRTYEFSEGVRQGRLRGFTKKRFTDVLNIGIGGSEIGPLLVSEALAPWIDGLRPHYISNLDGSDFQDTVGCLDPEKTLIVVVSKTFSTQETIHNATKAKMWLKKHLSSQAIPNHFVAVSADIQRAQKFGLDPDRIFEFWDWVGGRFSVWSSVGLSVMLAIGPERFNEFLQGANAMDQHFVKAPAGQNIPVIMAVLGILYRNGFGLQTHSVVPYDQRLAKLPAYLQQLEMESNGKYRNTRGERITYDTCPVIWGQSGTNAQHSFFQLLHQGTITSPTDFLLAAKAIDTDEKSHKLLSANCLSQIEVLSFGLDQDSIISNLINCGYSDSEARFQASHQSIPGNRPNSLFMYDQLTPKALGSLLTAYEHKVFTQGVLWDINSFDQWGVEHGKAICSKLHPALDSGDTSRFSKATQEAVAWLRSKQS